MPSSGEAAKVLPQPSGNLLGQQGPTGRGFAQIMPHSRQRLRQTGRQQQFAGNVVQPGATHQQRRLAMHARHRHQ